MTVIVKRLLPVLLPVVLAACAQTDRPDEAADSRVTTFTREGEGESVVIHSSIGGSSDIRNWRVIDSSTMIIETYRHGELIATFFSPCPGLRFAETLGFRTLGPFDLDRTTRVILPDGSSCQLRELRPYVRMEEADAPEE